MEPCILLVIKRDSVDAKINLPFLNWVLRCQVTFTSQRRRREDRKAGLLHACAEHDQESENTCLRCFEEAVGSQSEAS